MSELRRLACVATACDDAWISGVGQYADNTLPTRLDAVCANPVVAFVLIVELCAVNIHRNEKGGEPFTSIQSSQRMLRIPIVTLKIKSGGTHYIFLILHALVLTPAERPIRNRFRVFDLFLPWLYMRIGELFRSPFYQELMY